MGIDKGDQTRRVCLNHSKQIKHSDAMLIRIGTERGSITLPFSHVIVSLLFSNLSSKLRWPTTVTLKPNAHSKLQIAHSKFISLTANYKSLTAN